jgi:hypothetical protein
VRFLHMLHEIGACVPGEELVGAWASDHG